MLDIFREAVSICFHQHRNKWKIQSGLRKTFPLDRNRFSALPLVVVVVVLTVIVSSIFISYHEVHPSLLTSLRAVVVVVLGVVAIPLEKNGQAQSIRTIK